MEINQVKFAKVVEAAKAKTDDKRWLAAIDKAVAGVASGWIVTELADGIMVTTESGQTYHASEHGCQCEAFRRGQACKHRGLYRLVELYNAEPAEKYRITFNGRAVDAQMFDTPAEAVKEMGRVRDELQRNNANQVAVEYAPGIPSERGLLPDLFTVYPMCGGKSVYRIELYNAELETTPAHRKPEIVRSVERDVVTRRRVKVTRCDGWVI